MFPPLSFRRHPATLITMATIVALEVICSLGGDAARKAYYLDWLGVDVDIWRGELWRPFTTTLLHGGPIHAFFNLYWLALFGSVIEEWLGSWKTLALYVFLGMLSSLPQYVFSNYGQGIQEQILIVGFSGVNYGLFGLLLIGRKYRSEFTLVCSDSTARFLLGWFFLCILLTNMGMWPVANVAHGAGLIFGVLLGLTVFRRRERMRWLAVTVVAASVVLATLVYCPGHRGYEEMRRNQRARRGLGTREHLPPAPSNVASVFTRAASRESRESRDHGEAALASPNCSSINASSGETPGCFDPASVTFSLNTGCPRRGATCRQSSVKSTVKGAPSSPSENCIA